ncbi:transcriptional regulator [Labrys miyagiensis]|uniref:Transcriptional regulator n=1 Tax=Labrys miyagiensis TaxID=346912 RepID=A0ABQ6CR68_9HYPH|nr:helix-turn-helix transcriptional regulator [Labrys miyagiensis]GLS20691.1 transcriptional regulator [Labrys miyagiensis]
MNATQCKMARVALGWGVRELATAAKVSTQTVTRFERGDHLKTLTIKILQITLEEAGVEFIAENGGGVGVRLRNKSAGQQRWGD